MYMKTIKKWGGMLLSAIMLMSMMAIPGVLAEEAPIQITGLDQLQTIESGSYQLAANLTIPENAILTVPSDVTITLDLNGHTVSKPTGTGRILNNMGTMTINDSSEGKTGLVTAYRNTIGNFGTMVINGGTFETHCNVGGTAVMNEEGGTMTVNQIVVNADFFAVNNEGDMVINGGEFHSTSSNEPGTFAYCVRNFANMTINDATITGIQGALASASGVLKVYDGNFSTSWDNSRSFYALYIAGEVDVVTGFVYGGTFSSPKYAIYIGNDNKGGDGGINADATTYVYGGTYYGGKSAIYRAQETGNPYVTGGTYRIGQLPDDTPDPVVKNYMAEGCVYNETKMCIRDSPQGDPELQMDGRLLPDSDWGRHGDLFPGFHSRAADRRRLNLQGYIQDTSAAQEQNRRVGLSNMALRIFRRAMFMQRSAYVARRSRACSRVV